MRAADELLRQQRDQRTGDLGGLAGADQRFQSLATAVGAGDRTWRAFLSVEHDPAKGGAATEARGDWASDAGAPEVAVVGHADGLGPNQDPSPPTRGTRRTRTPAVMTPHHAAGRVASTASRRTENRRAFCRSLPATSAR
jgi:hypothetical protein